MKFASGRKSSGTTWHMTTQPGLAVALGLAANGPGEQPGLKQVRVVEGTSTATARLETLAGEVGLSRDRVRLLLEPGSYQFLQTETPQVPADEVRTALRWRIKEMLAQAPDETGFDALLPAASAEARKPLVYLAAAPNERLRERMLMFRPWNSSVESIGVAEVAQRNIADRVEEAGRATAVLAITPSGCLLTASCEGELLFVRNFAISCQSVNTSESVRRDQFERLVLELQRSFDVIERQNSMHTLSALWLAPFAHAEELRVLLVEALYLPVKILNLADLVDTRDCALPAAPDTQAAMFHLLGFALGSPGAGRAQIELVNPALLPPKPFFQFSTLVSASLLVAVATAILAYLIAGSLDSFLKVADQTHQRRVEREKQIAGLSTKVAVRQSDPALLSALVQERDLVARLRLVEASLRTPGKQAGSAATALKALSAAAVEGVWLQKIELAKQQLSVQGYATAPGRVPVYLDRLQAQPAFAGQRFTGLDLGRGSADGTAKDGEVLMFSLKSSDGGAP